LKCIRMNVNKICKYYPIAQFRPVPGLGRHRPGPGEREGEGRQP
jgi:hypothetical protein